MGGMAQISEQITASKVLSLPVEAAQCLDNKLQYLLHLLLLPELLFLSSVFATMQYHNGPGLFQ